MKIQFNAIKNIGIMNIKHDMLNLDLLRVKSSEEQFDDGIGNINNLGVDNDQNNEININLDEIDCDKDFIVLETYNSEYIALSEYRKTLKDPIYSKIKA